MNAISKLPDRFSETDVDDEIVIMRLDNGEFFSLSGTAAATWRLIDGSRNRAALISALASEYGTNEVEISADVDDFLVQLKELGLIAAT